MGFIDSVATTEYFIVPKAHTLRNVCNDILSQICDYLHHNEICFMLV